MFNEVREGVEGLKAPSPGALAFPIVGPVAGRISDPSP